MIIRKRLLLVEGIVGMLLFVLVGGLGIAMVRNYSQQTLIQGYECLLDIEISQILGDIESAILFEGLDIESGREIKRQGKIVIPTGDISYNANIMLSKPKRLNAHMSDIRCDFIIETSWGEVEKSRHICIVHQ